MNRLAISYVFTFLIICMCTATILPQKTDWTDLVALVSTRQDVERLLGKPEKYSGSFGIYRTPVGKFAVWYSSGKCEDATQGKQYSVPASRLVELLVYLQSPMPLTEFVGNLGDYVESPSPFDKDRGFYTSRDGRVSIETIGGRDDPARRVYSVTIQPGFDKEHLLCKRRGRPPRLGSIK